MFRPAREGLDCRRSQFGVLTGREQRFEQPEIHDVSNSIVASLSNAVIRVGARMELLCHLKWHGKTGNRRWIEAEPSRDLRVDRVVV
jgi:hypothetical protein